MRDLLKSILGLLLFGAIAFALGWGVCRRTHKNCPEPEVSSDTDTTITSTLDSNTVKPALKDSAVIHHIYIKVPIVPEKADSVPATKDSVPATQDSALVDIPIERKVYQEDSLYRAVVSGYRVSLDSLTLYPKTTTIKITNTVKTQPPKWSLGVNVGPSVLVTPSGKVHAGLGATVGLQYRF